MVGAGGAGEEQHERASAWEYAARSRSETPPCEKTGVVGGR